MSSITRSKTNKLAGSSATSGETSSESPNHMEALVQKSEPTKRGLPNDKAESEGDGDDSEGGHTLYADLCMFPHCKYRCDVVEKPKKRRRMNAPKSKATEKESIQVKKTRAGARPGVLTSIPMDIIFEVRELEGCAPLAGS
jgi:hypothetical protein